MNAKVKEALDAALERKKNRSPELVKQVEVMLVRACHLFMCTPLSLVNVDTQQHKWHRDLAPVLGGEGCDCLVLPFVVVGPEHFLEDCRVLGNRD